MTTQKCLGNSPARSDYDSAGETRYTGYSTK